MIAVLSPAKTLDETTPVPPVTATEPRFIDEAAKIAATAARLTPKKLQKLMHISAGLAELNADRFKAFELPFTPENARPALYMFDGDVYAGLAGPTLDKPGVAFAQAHVRILSGLYGLLRPLDLVQPYRLEMGVSIKVGTRKDLYAVWGKRVAAALAEELADHEDRTLINLASKEYFGAVDVTALPGDVIAIDFRDDRDGELRFNTFVAKEARGAMARYMVDERLDRPEGLKGFSGYGYEYRADHSDAERWAFVRKAGPKRRPAS